MEFKNAESGVIAVRKRHEIAEGDQWDLRALYAEEEEWELDFAEVGALVPRYEDFRGTLGQSAESLKAALEFDREVDQKLEKLGHFASLKMSENSADNDSLARAGKLDHLGTQASEASAFFHPEIQQISEKVWAELVADPLLKEWRSTLEHIRRYRPHILTEAEEKLLAMAASPLHGHGEIFSQLTNVDMKFGELEDEQGRRRELSQSTFSTFLESPLRAVRQKAFQQFYSVFQGHQYTLASCLANSVKADVFSAKARHYPSAREASLFPDRMPVAVYDGLIEEVRRGLPALHRYYELRRRILGLDELHVYDTYVPLEPEYRRQTTFEEAIDLVTASLEPLGADYVEVLEKGLRQERWCDRYECQGKRSGAFSSSSYGSPPYMLMNYQEEVFGDVYTLTHEAGHSMHSWYAMRHQPYQDYQYPIFLAEVASTFNEELLTHYLLEEITEPRMRAYLLTRQIDDWRATFFRQTMFAEFEKITHAMEEAGEALTLEVFTETYRELLRAYFGSEVVLDEELGLECLRIPHFYSAFYVYKYATGIAAAVTLSQKVLEGGAAEREAYLGFLKAGDSDYPLPILRRAGVDMESPEPVQVFIAQFEKKVDELEKLLG